MRLVLLGYVAAPAKFSPFTRLQSIADFIVQALVMLSLTLYLLSPTMLYGEYVDGMLILLTVCWLNRRQMKTKK